MVSWKHSWRGRRQINRNYQKYQFFFNKQINVFNELSIYSSFYLLTTYQQSNNIYLIYLSINLYIYLSISLSLYLSIYVYLIYLSIQVKLLAFCTMGKNVHTEIKCHSLLPLDDIVNMVCQKDTIPEVQIDRQIDGQMDRWIVEQMDSIDKVSQLTSPR